MVEAEIKIIPVPFKPDDYDIGRVIGKGVIGTIKLARHRESR